MASKRQLEANRANARLSPGPQTPAGKASSSKNALRHGLCAKTVVIGDETPEQFEELREGVTAHYRPTTALAHDAADRYAATLWRLRRVPAIEAALAEAARQQAYVEQCTQLEHEHRKAVYRDRLSEGPFQAPEKERMSAARTFLMLIEAAGSFDVLGKLNRYETALMNIASRQRKELEEHRVADEDPKLIDI